MKSKVSVVIPVLNEERFLPLLLNSLRQQTLQPEEIIVVDGESDDKTVTVARDYPVKLLSCPANVSQQRNLGAKNARGEIIIFIDADVVLREDDLEKLVVGFKQRKLAIAGTLLKPLSRRPLIVFVYWLINFYFFMVQKLLPTAAASTLLIKRDVWEQNIGFNPDLKFEDVELVQRIARKHRFGIIPRTIPLSARRMEKEGPLRTYAKYFIVAIMSLFRKYEAANRLSYEFGKYRRD